MPAPESRILNPECSFLHNLTYYSSLLRSTCQETGCPPEWPTRLDDGQLGSPENSPRSVIPAKANPALLGPNWPPLTPDLYPYLRLDTGGRSQKLSPLPWGEGKDPVPSLSPREMGRRQRWDRVSIERCGTSSAPPGEKRRTRIDSAWPGRDGRIALANNQM
jgi:hypothetical protein